MNKNTKIWLNSLTGVAVSAILLYNIWIQIQHQLSSVDTHEWWPGKTTFLFLCIVIMPLNLFIEVYKWKMLTAAAQPLSTSQAWSSYFAGIALSLITPNRIGEYPGRILYLRRKHTIRLISVAILGAFAQFITLFLYGIAGLIYYNATFPGLWPRAVLAISVAIMILLLLLFFFFEKWIVYFENIRWLRRFQTYGTLMKRFTPAEQLAVLGLSVFRFAIFTIQYLLLLYWMDISIPPITGFLLASLYFWVISVIPSIAFTELGIRGQVSLFLLHHVTGNTIGILAATIGLWCINLVVPAIIGSILLLRVRLLR